MDPTGSHRSNWIKKRQVAQANSSKSQPKVGDADYEINKAMLGVLFYKTECKF
jgi:hypothetical protein